MYIIYVKTIYRVYKKPYLVFGGYKWYKLLNFHTWVRSGRPGSDPGQTLDPLADPRPDLGPNGPIFPTWVKWVLT